MMASSAFALWTLSVSVVILAALLSRLPLPNGPPHVNYGQSAQCKACTTYNTLNSADASEYFSHAHLITPTSKDDVIEIVRLAVERGQKVRVVGTGHSWSAVAVPEDILVSLHNFTGIVSNPCTLSQSCSVEDACLHRSLGDTDAYTDVGTS